MIKAIPPNTLFQNYKSCFAAAPAKADAYAGQQRLLTAGNQGSQAATL
jgi:hypothetical protein